MRADAAAADDLRARGSELLVAAVRAGRSAGFSQRQIAEAIGRSQPEVSRLLRFHGGSPLGRRLSERRSSVIRAIKRAGGRNPRVFGSVARGTDHAGSDVDLLVDLPEGFGLFALARLERELSRILETPVEVVPDGTLRENLRDAVREEAVPL
jgi:predicted nucleotidyltransferase